jgi:hypothetical protein
MRNDSIITERIIGQDIEGRCGWPTSRYSSSTFLDELRKTTTNLMIVSVPVEIKVKSTTA